MRKRKAYKISDQSQSRVIAPWLSNRHKELLGKLPHPILLDNPFQILDSNTTQAVTCTLQDCDILQKRQDLAKNYDYDKGQNKINSPEKKARVQKTNSNVKSTKQSKKKIESNQQILSFKARLKLNPNAKKFIQYYCTIHTKVYNTTLKYIQQEIVKNTVFDSRTISIPGFQQIRPLIKNLPIVSSIQNVHSDLIPAAIRECLAKIKSTNEAMLTKGNKTGQYSYEMKLLDANRPNRSFVVDKAGSSHTISWNQTTREIFFWKTFTKHIKMSFKKKREFERWLERAQNSEQTSGGGSHFRSIIKYESPGRYYVILPFVNTKQETRSKPIPEVIALDPGVRAFQTSYDSYGTTRKFGTATSNDLLNIAKKADMTQRRMKSEKLWQTHVEKMQFGQIDQSEEIKMIKQSRYRKSYRRKKKKQILLYNEKIRNIRRDLHWNVANQLCETNDHILLPSFNTSEMVKVKNRKLNKSTVRSMLHLGHYDFKMRLKHVASKVGASVHDVSEAWTTKCCGSCGRIHHKIGSAKTFKCPFCPYTCDRDAHGARNIFIMNIEQYVGDIS